MKDITLRVLELFEDSVVTQFVLTTGVTSAVIYLIIMEKPIDPSLYAVWGGLIGFWFRDKVDRLATKKAENI